MQKYYLLDSGLKEIINGRNVTASDYIPAASQRAAIGERMEAFFQEYDLLITPTALPAFEAGAGASTTSVSNGGISGRPHYPFNLTQQPAGSVPCGFTQDGLPVGLQIIGARFTDGLVLKAARAYEADHPFEMPEGPISGG